jgi:hypothetical protein
MKEDSEWNERGTRVEQEYTKSLKMLSEKWSDLGYKD